jgi:FAD/FMN-containing dehydrogenase
MSDEKLDRALRSIERGSQAIVLQPGQHGYEDSRRVFNSSIDRRPSAIVRMRNCDDIPIVVRTLSESELTFSVRSGGHSIAGTSVADDVVMLDLSLLRRVEFDERSGVAKAEAGALWCDYDAVTTRYGCASTGGIVSHTGVAGLTLGGGLGWLMGEAGLACDALVGVSVVDANCELFEVEEDDPSLRHFRGAGRSLGVATKLRFRPVAIPPLVTAGRLTLSLSEAPTLMSQCAAAARESPDWLTVSPSFLWMNDDWCSVLDFVSTRNLAETSDALTDAYGLVPQRIAQVPYVAAQRQLDTELRFGRRNYWKSLALASLDSDVMERLAGHLRESPSRQTFLSVDVLHGRSLDEPVGGSSYGLRARPLVVLFNTIWEDPLADAENIRWCAAGFEMMASSVRDPSTYSNYFSDDDVGVQRGSERPLETTELARWRPNGLI